MKKIEVKVNEQMVEKLEGLAYEVEAMKGIIKGVITDNPNNPTILDSPLFKEYSKKYETLNREYEKLKTEMYSTFIKKEHLDAQIVTDWRLEYSTGILTYVILEDGDVQNTCTTCHK